MPHAACMLQMIRVLHAIIHNFVANSFACIFIADAFGKRKVLPKVPVCVCVYCQTAFGSVGGEGRGRGRTVELFEMPVEL